MEENSKNIELEKEEQELLDFLSKAIARSIERKRAMEFFKNTEDIMQYFVDSSLLLRINDLLMTHGGKVTFTLRNYRDEKAKFEEKYGKFNDIQYNYDLALGTIRMKEKRLAELMELVDLLDFHQKDSIFGLINDPGILSDEKKRKLLVKYFGKAVWEEKGVKDE